MYIGPMDCDFVLGDFSGVNPNCESVALLRDFLGSQELSKRLPTTAETDTLEE